MPTMRNVGKITYPVLPSHVSGTGINLAYSFCICPLEMVTCGAQRGGMGAGELAQW